MYQHITSLKYGTIKFMNSKKISKVSSININNSHVTCSKLKNPSKVSDQIKQILLLPVLVENNSSDQGQVSGAAISLGLHSMILINLQCITLSDTIQNSTRLGYYVHSHKNCFLNYLDDVVPDDSVIYMADTQFWYSEKEGMFTEVLENLTGNVFLATSRDHKLLLSYRSTVLHTFIESKRSNHKYIHDHSSNKTSHMPLSPSNPSESIYPTHMLP